jgi:S1-C subfamily serine protease
MAFFRTDDLAFQGHINAQGNLGVAYANGEGILKNSVESLAWFNIAAMAGNESASKSRDMLEQRVGPEGTLAAQQRSEQLLNEIEVAKRGTKIPTSKLPEGWSLAENDGKPRLSGSGTIVTAQGHVITAAHVVAGAKRVTITTGQGIKNATIVRVDEANDLAVLKITEGKYTPLPLASSRKVQLGQSVSTIGFPNIEIQGFSPKVTRGEISSFDGIGDDPRAWQISVPVQTGNSGGPLLDENGNVVGVVVSKLGIKAVKLTGDIPQNVNYAVKGAYALALLEPYLGNDAPEPTQPAIKPRFEDMVAKAQQSVVLILVY